MRTWKVVSSIVIALLSVSNVHAQRLFVGPEVGYTASLSVPEEVSNVGAPNRFRIGASLYLQGKSKISFRFSLGYRIENGEFKTDYQEPVAGTTIQNRLNVVEPTPGAPKVTSELQSSSIDLAADAFFPLADLDTTGSKMGVTLGIFSDRVMRASQTDDYGAIPDYTGPKTLNTSYRGQFGFGVMVGLSTLFPIGESNIIIDIKYIVRQPSTLLTDAVPSVEQNVGWLIGKGLRISAAYLIPL